MLKSSAGVLRSLHGYMSKLNVKSLSCGLKNSINFGEDKILLYPRVR